MRPCLVVLAVLLLIQPAESRGGRRPKPPTDVVVTADGDLERIVASPPAESVGFLYTPKSLVAGEKGGLVVMLHGHGGTPKGVIKRDLAEKRGWFYLSVQGGGNEQTPQGPGHSWSQPDTERVLALTRWVVANRPVDPEKVVLVGFSAGGTMSLWTWPEEPALFAGIVTCSSPEVPGSRHEAARVAVFLGTKDPNFRNAPAVRNVFEKRKAGGALLVVDGAEHNDLPHTTYLDLALSWILEPKARGQEARIPKAPPEASASRYRHILVAWTGARGAPADLRRRKSGAKSLAGKVQKMLARGLAWFPHEAQAHSDDAATAAVGGAISLDALLAAGGKLAEMREKIEGAKAGTILGPFESETGYHLVLVEAAE